MTKAGDYDRVILADEADRPRGVTLGRDRKAEHERHRCEPLLRWLGVDRTAATLAGASCRPVARSPRWALGERDPKGAATVLVVNEVEARRWRTRAAAIEPGHVLRGAAPEHRVFGAEQDDDGMVTARDEDAFALVGFRDVDRRFVRDVAAASRTIGSRRVLALGRAGAGPGGPGAWRASRRMGPQGGRGAARGNVRPRDTVLPRVPGHLSHEAAAASRPSDEGAEDAPPEPWGIMAARART